MLNTKENFITKKLDKQNYIDQMYEKNNQLFEYVKLIKDTDIKSIQISDKGVLFTSKEQDIKMLCTKNDKRSAPFEIMNFDNYESDDAAMIYKLIEDEYTVFDIGANIGWYSLNIAKKKKNVQIFSFEPVHTTFENLEKNIQLNNCQEVIKYFNFGFSNEAKDLEFYISNLTSVSSSAINITESEETQKMVCKVITLDEFVIVNNVKLDFIKCDVEGAELFVYQGAINTLTKQKPIVFSEMLRKWSAKYNYHPNDIIQLFKRINYNCFVINKNLTLNEIQEVTLDTLETNFIFLHSEKHDNIINQLS